MEKKVRNISLLVGGTFLMENLDSTVISTALPEMAKSFHTNAVRLSAGITSYIIMLAVFIPISGWIADRFGTRKVFGSAIAGFVLASVACGLSENLTHFVIARILQGLAGALMVPVGRLSVLKNTSKKDLVSAIAYITWPGLIGPILGPIFGGIFTTYLTWHWIFFINVPLGITAFILTIKIIPNIKGTKTVPLDFLGFLLNGVALSSFMYSMEMFSRESGNYTFTIITLVASIILIILSVYFSKKHANPLIDYSILKYKTFGVAVYSGSLSRMVIGMAPFLIPLMFQVGFGLNPFQSGMLFMASMVGNLVMKPATIWITKKYTFKSVLIINGMFLAISTFVTALLNPTTPVWMIVTVMFLSGMIRSMQFSSINTMAYADIPPEKMSNANTLFSTAQQMSMGMGIALGALSLHVSSMIHKTNSHYQMKDFHLALNLIGIIGILSLIEYFRLSPENGNSVRGV